MDLTTIIEMVNSIGFPVAVCAALFWTNSEQSKCYRELLQEFRETIDNNTKAINQVIQQLAKR